MQREELEEVGERGERPRWGEKMGRGRRRRGGGGEKGEGVDREECREVGGEGGTWGGHSGFLKTPFFVLEKDKVPESLERKMGRGANSNERKQK